MFSVVREEIGEFFLKINLIELSIELYSLDNVVYLLEKSKDKKKLSFEE